jgi:hypothetical protein
MFSLPSQSYLCFEGKLVKRNAAVYADDDLISLILNGIMYLFKNIKYEISGKIIENVNNPGITSTIKGLLTYSKDFDDSIGLQLCWNRTHTSLQEYIIKKSDPKGTFNFQIPLGHLFGFCEDYDKVIYGVKQQLIFLRNTDNDAIYKVAGPAALPVPPDDGKIHLSKLTWLMPHIIPSDVEKIKLYKSIESKVQLPIAFRERKLDKVSVPQGSTSFTWRLLTSTLKPRWVIVTFQTDKENNQVKNPATFDHCDLLNIKAIINGNAYPPGVDLNLNFKKNFYAKAYQMYMNFRRDYYNDSSVCMHPIEFKDKYPLFVMDCSRQSERLKDTICDVKLEMTFNSEVAANTYCYALVISDRILSLKSDGNKMEIII